MTSFNDGTGIVSWSHDAEKLHLNMSACHVCVLTAWQGFERSASGSLCRRVERYSRAQRFFETRTRKRRWCCEGQGRAIDDKTDKVEGMCVVAVVSVCPCFACPLTPPHPTSPQPQNTTPPQPQPFPSAPCVCTIGTVACSSRQLWNCLWAVLRAGSACALRP